MARCWGGTSVILVREGFVVMTEGVDLVFEAFVDVVEGVADAAEPDDYVAKAAVRASNAPVQFAG